MISGRADAISSSETRAPGSPTIRPPQREISSETQGGELIRGFGQASEYIFGARKNLGAWCWIRAKSLRMLRICRSPAAARSMSRARVRISDSTSASERGFSARNCVGIVSTRATVSGWNGTEPIISVGRSRAIFSMDSLRQQSPTTGNPRTEATSPHHRVTATRFRLAPSAQRMDVQDGASETMRGSVLRLEMWRAGILQQNSKPRFAVRRAAESGHSQLAITFA